MKNNKVYLSQTSKKKPTNLGIFKLAHLEKATHKSQATCTITIYIY